MTNHDSRCEATIYGSHGITPCGCALRRAPFSVLKPSRVAEHVPDIDRSVVERVVAACILVTADPNLT